MPPLATADKRDGKNIATTLLPFPNFFLKKNGNDLICKLP